MTTRSDKQPTDPVNVDGRVNCLLVCLQGKERIEQSFHAIGGMKFVFILISDYVL